MNIKIVIFNVIQFFIFFFVETSNFVIKTKIVKKRMKRNFKIVESCGLFCWFLETRR